MLEQLLELITYEKLLLFFKELSLLSLQEQKLNPNLFKSKSLPIEVPIDLNFSHAIIKINDSEVLEQILPLEIAKKMFAQGNLTLLAFVFALRHKITILNILFHISSVLIDGIHEDFLRDLDKILNFNISKLFYEHEKLLQPVFWSSHAQLPIIGFSAVGCLFSMQNLNKCRAFDHYDIASCGKESKIIFCPVHQREVFWKNQFEKDSSTQAKMFRFYLEKNNFSEFDEISLQKIINIFFSKYINYKNNFKNESPEKVKYLLEFYEFININELKQFGLEELRKRFLEKAKQLHPDMGGSQDLFREARNNYELLRELI